MLIPLELLSIIIEKIEEKQDLLNLRLVSPAAHCQATPRAFRQLHVTPEGAGSVLGLIGALHLAKHVHEIIFDIPEDLQDTVEGDDSDCEDQDGGQIGDPDNNPEDIQGTSGGRRESLKVQHLIQIGDGSDCEDEDGTRMQAREQVSRSTILRSFFNNLFKLPALGTLRLHFPVGWLEQSSDKDSPIRKVQDTILESLLTSKPVPTLRYLEIRCLLSLSNPSLRSPTLASFLKPVQVFQLEVTADYADELHYNFWRIDARTLFGCLPTSLTRFSLSIPVLDAGLERRGWDNLTFPNLTSLHLNNLLFYNGVVFNPAQNGLEAFILRHSTSLEALHLEKCSIEFEDGDPNPRTWGYMWDQFAGRMTRLEEFKFHPLPGRDPKDPERYHGYACMAFEIGDAWVNIFDDDSLNPPSKDPDLAAYNNLQNIIRERRIRTIDI